VTSPAFVSYPDFVSIPKYWKRRHSSECSGGVKIADTWEPYRAYQTMMRFNSEWRDRAGTEALYPEGGMFGLVRIHSMEEDSRTVDFCVERIPWPGLPFLLGSRLRDSFRVGASWDYLSIERGHWAADTVYGLDADIRPRAKRDIQSQSAEIAKRVRSASLERASTVRYRMEQEAMVKNVNALMLTPNLC